MYVTGVWFDISNINCRTDEKNSPMFTIPQPIFKASYSERATGKEGCGTKCIFEKVKRIVFEKVKRFLHELNG